jgi:hypothetical protein
LLVGFKKTEMKKQVKKGKASSSLPKASFKRKFQKFIGKKSNILVGAGILGGAGAITLAAIFVPWKKVADSLEYNLLRIEEEFNALVEESPVEQSNI